VLVKNENGSLRLPFLGISPSSKITLVGRLIQGTNWPVSRARGDGRNELRPYRWVAWLFAGEGELVAVGVFEDAARAPFFLFGLLGELDAFGF